MSDIKDAASFNRTVAMSKQVAALYFYQQLDCLVDLAYVVSYDFFARPHLHVSIDVAGRTPPLTDVIAGLRTRLGSDPDHLSKAQREAVHLPLFGPADVNSAVGSTSGVTLGAMPGALRACISDRVVAGLSFSRAARASARRPELRRSEADRRVARSPGPGKPAPGRPSAAGARPGVARLPPTPDRAPWPSTRTAATQRRRPLRRLGGRGRR
ncbi:hypothetical protein [Embleya scabrispora]|uniref:hypothetical protein n=1 Tax=Embleya scabrispora TaxID=159449 RepID=UPI00131A40AD|nr:hypothetical protein [Embleya scabrispora]MYS80508.1 hypothetical protein [Streptomyces sp. SID5474]